MTDMKLTQLAGALALAAILAPACASAQTYPAQTVPYGTQPVPYGSQTQTRWREGRYLRAVYALPLSAQQRQQIDQYVAAEQQASQGASKQTKRADRKQLKQQIDSVLSPQQVAQVQAEVRAEKAARMQQRQTGTVPPPIQ